MALNLRETETLLREMFAIDGRKLEADKIAAWRESLSSMQLDVAQAALRSARADERIKYVEPKHIWGKAKDAAMELDRKSQQSEMKAEEDSKTHSACPTCVHGLSLLLCTKCCRTLMNLHESHQNEYGECGELCNTFAKENLLA